MSVYRKQKALVDGAALAVQGSIREGNFVSRYFFPFAPARPYQTPIMYLDLQHSKR